MLPEKDPTPKLSHHLPPITCLVICARIDPEPHLFQDPHTDFKLVAALILKRLEQISTASTEDGREEVAACYHEGLRVSLEFLV
jgi:hypothetical protein